MGRRIWICPRCFSEPFAGDFAFRVSIENNLPATFDLPLPGGPDA